jgi:hypothetical protein
MSVLPRYWSGGEYQNAVLRERPHAHPTRCTSNTFNTFLQDNHSPVPAFPALWTDFFLRMSTITEPFFDGTQRHALRVMRIAYYLVDLDGECGHMIVEAAPPGSPQHCHQKKCAEDEAYISDLLDTHCTYTCHRIE